MVLLVIVAGGFFLFRKSGSASTIGGVTQGPNVPAGVENPEAWIQKYRENLRRIKAAKDSWTEDIKRKAEQNNVDFATQQIRDAIWLTNQSQNTNVPNTWRP